MWTEGSPEQAASKDQGSGLAGLAQPLQTQRYLQGRLVLWEKQEFLLPVAGLPLLLNWQVACVLSALVAVRSPTTPRREVLPMACDASFKTAQTGCSVTLRNDEDREMYPARLLQNFKTTKWLYYKITHTPVQQLQHQLPLYRDCLSALPRPQDRNLQEFAKQVRISECWNGGFVGNRCFEIVLG